MIAILNHEAGIAYCEKHERYDEKVVRKFLETALSQYHTGRIVIILDNARIHHIKPIQSFLDENKTRLELMFLLPYSPELNLRDSL